VRPGRVIWAALLYYGYRTAAAALASYPLATALAAPVSRYRAGDALLFEPGGLLLVDALTRSEPWLRELVAPTLVVGALASFGALLPAWWLMRSLCGGSGRGVGRELSGFSLLGGGYWLFRALWAALLASLALSIGSLTRSAADERVPALCMALTLGAGALAGLIAATLHDLARAELVCQGGGGVEALGRAWASLFRTRRGFAGLLLAHAGLWSVSLLVAAALLALAGLPGADSAWWGHPAMLQLAVAAAVAARAVWFGLLGRRARRSAQAQAEALL
jgi:hypothetical protein